MTVQLSALVAKWREAARQLRTRGERIGSYKGEADDGKLADYLDARADELAALLPAMAERERKQEVALTNAILFGDLQVELRTFAEKGWGACRERERVLVALAERVQRDYDDDPYGIGGCDSFGELLSALATLDAQKCRVFDGLCETHDRSAGTCADDSVDPREHLDVTEGYRLLCVARVDPPCERFVVGTLSEGGGMGYFHPDDEPELAVDLRNWSYYCDEHEGLGSGRSLHDYRAGILHAFAVALDAQKEDA